MKHITAFAFFLLPFLTVAAQSVKPEFRIALGVQQTSLYSEPFYSNEAATVTITGQKALILPDIMTSVKFPSKQSAVAPFLGLGFNRKGTEVSGFDISYDPLQSFKKKAIASYLSVPVGAEWTVLKHREGSFLISQALVSELPINAAAIYRKLAFSSRTQLVFEFPSTNKVNFSIIPFFQTAISSYSEEKYELRSDTKAYRPFSFGLSVACSFR